MIKKLSLSILIIALAVIVTFSASTTQAQTPSAPATLIYLTESGIYALDQGASAPRTLIGWVSVIGRQTCASLSISPRGRFIAAVHPESGVTAGYSLDLIKLPDGSESRKVLKQVIDLTKQVDIVDMICNNAPAWSPDGTHIAFRGQPDTAHPILYSFNITALTPRQIALPHAGIEPGPPYWSPQNTWIVYADYNPTGDESLYLVPSDGSQDPLLIYSGAQSGALASLEWVTNNQFVTTHQDKDCLTNFRLSEIPSRSSHVLFGGCASASAFDDVHNSWLINVIAWDAKRSTTPPGLYLISIGGTVTHVDVPPEPTRIQWEPIHKQFILFGANGANTVDPVSGAVKPYTLPGGVAFPPETQISVSPDGTQTVFATHDGVWLADPNGSAVPLITDAASQTLQLSWSPDSQSLYVIRSSGLWLYTKGGKAALVTSDAITWAGWTVMQ